MDSRNLRKVRVLSTTRGWGRQAPGPSLVSPTRESMWGVLSMVLEVYLLVRLIYGVLRNGGDEGWFTWTNVVTVRGTSEGWGRTCVSWRFSGWKSLVVIHKDEMDDIINSSGDDGRGDDRGPVPSSSFRPVKMYRGCHFSSWWRHPPLTLVWCAECRRWEVTGPTLPDGSEHFLSVSVPRVVW